MKFNLYDRNLALVETIRHEERTVISMEYDIKTDLTVVASAYGLSVWRTYRAISLDMSHVMEKMFSFPNCPQWISRLQV